VLIFFVSGVSRKTQELYAIVFLARYLDLFTDFISVYNSFMKVVFIGSSLAIVWCMRVHPMVRRSYDKELDTFRHYFLVAACFLLALVLHEKFTFQEVPYFFFNSLYLVHVIFLLIHALNVVFSSNSCCALLIILLCSPGLIIFCCGFYCV
jgi:ER lumen protein retaining receptor